jgi:hypothetical protein
MDTNEAVQKIADAYATAEEAAGAAKRAFAGAKDAWEALRDAGVIGNLEMQTRMRRLNALAVTFEADLFALHLDDTQRAAELGVDLPQPRSGGGR